MNKQNLECVNITNDTKIESNEKNLNDTTKKWERKCPNCNEIVYHTSKCNRDRLNKSKCLCIKCTGKSQRMYNSERLERNCNMCNKITIYKTRTSFNQAEKQKRLCFNCTPRLPCKDETKRKIGMKNSGIHNGMYGKTHSDEYKNILRSKLKNKPLVKTKDGIEKMKKSLLGRKHSDETKLKQRLSHINRLKNNGWICPMHNKRACDFIDEYNKHNNYNFVHALNGGEFYIKELGYFVDGYDKENNVVFEYDEKHHFEIDGNLKKRDIERMNEIKKLLNCKFIRYNEKLNEIKEY